MMVQNILLEYTIKWYVASSQEERDKFVNAANKVRTSASEGSGWWLEHAKEFTEGTLDILNGIVGTPESISKFQRDELLEVVNIFQDISISNSKNNIRQGMGSVVGLFTGASEEKIALKGVTSLIKNNKTLVKYAEQAGADEVVQKQINNVIKQFIAGGNHGRGIEHLFGNIYYLRGGNEARVFYRMNNGVMEILGKANKDNEQKVINMLEKLYKN